MRLTVMFACGVLLTACGGGSTGPVASPPTAGTTSTAAPSLEERAELLEYNGSVPLDVVEKKTRSRKGAAVVDLAFQAAGRRVPAYLVRPASRPRAAVL
jgi:hypothetical protein